MQNICLTSALTNELRQSSQLNPTWILLAESQLDCGTIYLASNCSLAQICLATVARPGQQSRQLSLVDSLGGHSNGASIKPIDLTCLLSSDADSEWLCLCTQKSICQVEFQCSAKDNGRIEPQLQVMGEFDNDILAVSWSPGCDSVAIVTSNRRLILMDSQFDPMWESDLDQPGFGKEAFIDLGWGKKETQFHGSAGKAAALQPKETAPAPAAQWDSANRVGISWRGDASAICTSSISALNGARQLRVWSPMDGGALLTTSDPACSGLEWALDWRPSGSLIAAARRRTDVAGAPAATAAHGDGIGDRGQMQIQLLERNGLCHGEFSVRAATNTTDIERIRWNSSSEVLLVELVDRSNPKALKTVQLWSSCNYHWYLRWSSDYPTASIVDWSTAGSGGHWCSLRILNQAEGTLTTLRFHWEVSRCRQQLADCNTCIPVIDGSRLQVTPLRLALVPPPMSAFHVDFVGPNSQVLWSRPLPDKPNWLAVALSNGRLFILCPIGESSALIDSLPPSNGQSELSPTVCSNQCSSGFGFVNTVPDYCCVDVGLTLSNVSTSHLEPLSGLRLLQFDSIARQIRIWNLANQQTTKNEGNLVQINLENALAAFEAVVSVNANGPANQAYLQTDLRKIITVNFASGTINSSEVADLLEPCPLTDLTAFGDGQSSQVLLCLSDTLNLYCLALKEYSTASVIARVNGVTSYCLHDSFLLVTGVSHVLVSVDRTSSSSATSISDAFHSLADDLSRDQRQQQQQRQQLATRHNAANDPRGCYSDRVRRIERGAKLVACCSNDSLTVLQMPRGNLEGIHPRSLVLLRVSALLDRCDYGQAFELMRRHRINLNLLVDHSPTNFMASVDKFIDSVSNEDYINVFIAELDNASVTSGMYSRAYANRNQASPDWSAWKSTVPQLLQHPDKELDKDSLENLDKITAVCSALLANLEARNANKKWLTCRLSAWVKLGRLDLALRLLANGDSSNLDHGFRHLLYLADVHTLYNCALGTYDLELALLVAQRTRRDPKDYVGLLKQLAEMTELERRGVIDLQLARYARAVANFTACGSDDRFQIAMRLAKEKLLFATACLQLGDCSDNDRLRRVSAAWSSELKSAGQLEWSGLVNYQAGLYPEAAEAFRAALCPEMWLAAKLLSESNADLDKVIETLEKEANGIAARLCDTGRHTEAVNLLTAMKLPIAECSTSDSQAFKAALGGCLWQRCELFIAQAIASRHPVEASQLRLTLIKAALQASEQELADAAKDVEQFVELRSRLIQVREAREARAAGVFDDLQSQQQLTGLIGPDDDAFSDVGSTVSRSSSASLSSNSTGTRKSRRKARRKLETASTKPGHPLEELGLLNSLADCLARRSRRLAPARQLCGALTGLGRHSEAARLRQAVAKSLSRLTCGSAGVWPSTISDENDDASSASSTTMLRTAQAFGCVLSCMCRPDSLLTELETAKAAWQRLDWGGDAL